MFGTWWLAVGDARQEIRSVIDTAGILYYYSQHLAALHLPAGFLIRKPQQQKQISFAAIRCDTPRDVVKWHLVLVCAL